MEDPRPDLQYDSNDWTRLLNNAEAKDPMLAGVLHGFRCGGLRLHKGAKGYALRPDFDPLTSIWKSKSEYEIDRDKWLIPSQGEIVELLNNLLVTEKAKVKIEGVGEEIDWRKAPPEMWAYFEKCSNSTANNFTQVDLFK